jgi:DMSO/TMAO reductase YedYZ molybdopterin-dependent catalytic subunit
VRLVSPDQYGFVSTKHLCRIELHEREPKVDTAPVDRMLAAHPRARVWHEERHRHLPACAVRLPYRLLIPPIRYLSARGFARIG